MVVAIAVADSLTNGPLGLGNLYLLPIIMVAGFLRPGQVILMSLVCVGLREAFNHVPFGPATEVITRLTMSLTGFLGTGLFTREVIVNRQRLVDSLASIEQQVRLRQDAEEQLRVLVESSPAAIMILDEKGHVRDSNLAADRLFAAGDAPMRGELIRPFLPVLGAVPMADRDRQPFCTKIETRGRRRSGEVFPAHIWVSTFNTHSGGRMAAIILDASEDLREREEEGLHRLLSQSHIVAGAVWHEVRNICAAITVVHANMRRVKELTDSPDFQALGNLVEGLKHLASAELRPSTDTVSEEVDLREVLEDLRIVVGGQFAEAEAELRVEVADDVDSVIAQRYGLLQVFLNLAQNALRAMLNEPGRVLRVTATMEQSRVVIRFHDSGHGVADPRYLFQPFQRGAQMVGLGLYVSRAMVRDFLGDLTNEPVDNGCCFSVILNPARVPVEVAHEVR